MPDFAPFSLPAISPAQQLEQVANFRLQMSTRRTVRHFSPQPFPVEWIEQAIATAASAPSGANQQPWRFVVVSDPDLKRQIRIAAEAEERENYENRFPQEWLDALTPFGTDWQKPFLEICPYIIVVFRIDYGLDGDRKIKHYYVQESVGIATGFLIAALHLAGLATLTHTPSPMGFLGQILDRPANERPFLLIPVGYPAQHAQVPVLAKKSLDEVMVRR
ncbi:MAG: nitroreductase family protein [Acidobacteria bacterium]|nr:nitroreductase family protein [Acidobacteriota bacterium]